MGSGTIFAPDPESAGGVCRGSGVVADRGEGFEGLGIHGPDDVGARGGTSRCPIRRDQLVDGKVGEGGRRQISEDDLGRDGLDADGRADLVDLDEQDVSVEAAAGHRRA